MHQKKEEALKLTLLASQHLPNPFHLEFKQEILKDSRLILKSNYCEWNEVILPGAQNQDQISKDKIKL